MDSLEVMNLSGCSKLDKLPEEFFGTIQTLREFCVDGTAITELPSFVLSQCNLQVLEFGRCEEKQSRWRLPSKMQHPQSLIMPSLAALCSLRRLDLSYRNILEVSDSIGGLSCLEYLFLQGNNFTSFPIGCLSRLSRLLSLGLSSCKKLEVLPELPPNLHFLHASDCTSLYQLSPNNDHKIPSSLGMILYSCPKLFRNHSIERQVCMSQPVPHVNSAITSHSFRNQISSFLQFVEFPSNTCGIFGGQERQVFGRDGLDIIYHGNIIPRWFTNTSMGNHIQVELPPNFCYNKMRGYGICVVFTPKKSCCNYVNAPRCHMVYDPEWREAKNFVTFSIEHNDDDVEIKECGVKLVFDEDIQGEETDFSFTQDFPTPTQDGGAIDIPRNNRGSVWSW